MESRFVYLKAGREAEIIFARTEEFITKAPTVRHTRRGACLLYTSVLLQNTRFRKEETKNIEDFSKELASLADCYVDDAFGSCHRAHCSTEGVTKFLSPCVAGYLIGKELDIMGKALENPDRPFVAVLGLSLIHILPERETEPRADGVLQRNRRGEQKHRV